MAELWSYAAAVENADKAATDAALAAVSGQFANLFSTPCIREEDPDDLDPPRAWTTNIFQVDRAQRREIKNAIQSMQTLVYEEQDRRVRPRYPDPSEYFIAKYQWRLRPNFDEATQTFNHTYVHATGLFKTSVLSSPQQIGTDWALLDQWDVEQDMVNTFRSGDGNRIQLAYTGRYLVDARMQCDPTIGFEVQLVVNTTPTGPIYSFVDVTSQADYPPEEYELNVDDKLGVLIRSLDTTLSLNLLQGSWFGTRRIN